MDTEQYDPIQTLQVMVVDDDRVFRNYIEAQLEMLGCQIVSVESGDAAWPIIEQDVIRVSHRDTVEDLVRKGKDMERLVLARAVRLHLHHRVLTYGNKTVVFE